MHLALATHEIRFSGRLGIEHYKTGMAFQDVIDGPFKNDVPSITRLADSIGLCSAT